MHRRTVLAALSAAAMAGGTYASAQTRPAKAAVPGTASLLAAKLRIVIPANAGGGWDQTGRALGAAMLSAGVVQEVEYENKGGKGGTVGLAHYAQNYGNDLNTMLMGGLVMVGAVALQRPAVDMRRIRPLARLTSDYLVVVVPANSPLRSIRDFAEAMQTSPKTTPIAGGSAGGVDHVFAGVFARSARSRVEDLVYLPFAGGAEVVEALLSGKAAVGISGFSEFRTQLASGELRAIGVSSKRALFGIPAIREQGVDADMANWRGVFTGDGVPAARQAEMVQAVRTATLQDNWKRTLEKNRWESAWLSDANFSSFIDVDMSTSQIMVHLLKLKA